MGWDFPEGEDNLAGKLRQDMISTAVAKKHPE
jgi:hypothetical protein